VPRPIFETMWDHSVLLLQRGQYCLMMHIKSPGAFCECLSNSTIGLLPSISSIPKIRIPSAQGSRHGVGLRLLLVNAVCSQSFCLSPAGFKSGSILTVDPEEARQLGPPWTRRYIYNHRTCGRWVPVPVWRVAVVVIMSLMMMMMMIRRRRRRNYDQGKEERWE
jgi:hypothetical protein